MTLFNFSELKAAISAPALSASPDAVRAEQYLQEHYQKIESVKQLIGNPPKIDCAYYLWSLNSFNAFTFVPYLIKEHGHIQALHISTYSISKRIVDALFKLLQRGQIGQITLFVSDSLKFRVPKVVDHLQAMQAQFASIFTVIYGWNHSKITLAQCGPHYYTIEGSGNWSENAQFEQYSFINKQSLFQFRLECIQSAAKEPLKKLNQQNNAHR